MISRCVCIAGLLIGASTLPGCLERRMTITSEPPGATATVNGVEVGRTPVTAAFTFYGDYEVELEREGYEPIRTKAKATTPIYEYPPVDLLASAMPFTISNTVRWHYKMQPELTTTQSKEELEKRLLGRAAELRKRVE